MKNDKVTILGPGAYGLSLSLMFYENTHNIILWSHLKEEIEELKQNHGNEKRLPGITIPNEIKFTNNLEEAIKDASIIVFATPAFAIEDICKKLKPIINKKQIICIATKGIQNDSCMFLSEVTKKYLDNPITVIAGPTFAIDLAKLEPAALTIASTDKNAMKLNTELLENNHLKIEQIDDVIGVEFLRAIKNVIAIASGILNGLGNSTSTNAFMITEVLKHFTPFLKKLGGNPNSILTFAGIGDLMLTCTSEKSRNFSFGKIIGETKDKDKITEYLNTNTVEGRYTLESVHQMLKRKNIDLPIIDILYRIIYNYEDPNILIDFLMDKK